jgi:hypothetical protein
MSLAIICSRKAFVASGIGTPVVVGSIRLDMRDMVSLEVLFEGVEVLASVPLALIPPGSHTPRINRAFAWKRSIWGGRSEFWTRIIGHRST